MLPRSGIRPGPQAQQKNPGGAFQGAGGAAAAEPAPQARGPPPAARTGTGNGGRAGGRRGPGTAGLTPALATGREQAAADGRGERASDEFFRNKYFFFFPPEHPWWSRCNHPDCRSGKEGGGIGADLARWCLPETSRRGSHGTWRGLTPQGGQRAPVDANPPLPDRSPRKIVARRSDAGEDERAVTKALFTKGAEGRARRPAGLVTSAPPPSRGAHRGLFGASPPPPLLPGSSSLPRPRRYRGHRCRRLTGKGAPSPALPPAAPQRGTRLSPTLPAGGRWDASGDLAAAGLRLCPLWGQRASEGTRRAPHGHTPAFCPPPTLCYLPTDGSAALS